MSQNKRHRHSPRRPANSDRLDPAVTAGVRPTLHEAPAALSLSWIIRVGSPAIASTTTG